MSSIDQSYFTLQNITETQNGKKKVPIKLGDRYTKGGTLANIIKTDVGFTANSTANNPVVGNSRLYGTDSIEFSMNDISPSEIKITLYGSRDNNDNTISQYDDRTVYSIIDVDMAKQTYSGSFFFFDRSNNPSNTATPHFSWVNQDMGSSIQNAANKQGEFGKGYPFKGYSGKPDLTVSYNNGKITINHIYLEFAIAYLIEYLETDNDSLNLTITQSRSLERTSTNSSTNFELSDNSDIIILEGSGSQTSTDNYRYENKSLFRIIIKKENGIYTASGIVAVIYGANNNRQLTFGFKDYVLEKEPINIGTVDPILNNSTVIGDITASIISFNPKLYINNKKIYFDDIVINDSVIVNHTYLIIANQYTKQGVGCAAINLPSSFVRDDSISKMSTSSGAKLKFNVPFGADYGVIRFMGQYNPGHSSNTNDSNVNQNMILYEIWIDLVRNKMSGYSLGIRVNTPDFVSWSDIDIQNEIILMSSSGNADGIVSNKQWSTLTDRMAGEFSVTRQTDSNGEYIYIDMKASASVYSLYDFNNGMASWRGLEGIKIVNTGGVIYVGDGVFKTGNTEYLVTGRSLLNDKIVNICLPDNYNGSFNVNLQRETDTNTTLTVPFTVTPYNSIYEIQPINTNNTDPTGNTIKELLSTSPKYPTYNNNYIAISNITTNNIGDWQYNNGSAWITIDKINNNKALLLTSSDKLRFLPNNNITSSTEVSIEHYAWDGSGNFSSGDIINLNQKLVYHPIRNANVTMLSENTATTKVRILYNNDVPIMENIIENIYITNSDPINIANTITVTDDVDKISEILIELNDFKIGDVVLIYDELFNYGSLKNTTLIKTINSTPTTMNVDYDGDNMLNIMLNNNPTNIADTTEILHNLKYSLNSVNIIDELLDDRIITLQLNDVINDKTLKYSTIIKIIDISTEPVISKYDQLIWNLENIEIGVNSTAKLFHSDVDINTKNANEKIQKITIQLSNIVDTDHEYISLYNYDINLQTDYTITTNNGIYVGVVFNNNTSTVEFTKYGDITLVDGINILKNLTYKNTSTNPQTTDGISLPRNIKIKIKDTGNNNTRTINNIVYTGKNESVLYNVKNIIINTSLSVPILYSNGSTTHQFTESSEAIQICPTLSISVASEITKIFINLSNMNTNDAESIFINNQQFMYGSHISEYIISQNASISYTENDRIILTCTTTNEAQNIIQSIQYRSDSSEFSIKTRNIEIVAENSINQQSTPLIFSVQMIAINNRPTISTTSQNPLYYNGTTAMKLFEDTIISLGENSSNVRSIGILVENITTNKEYLKINNKAVNLAANNRVNLGKIDGTTTIANVGPRNNGSMTVNLIFTKMSKSHMKHIIDNMYYYNYFRNENVSTTRNISITHIQDTGGTSNGGIDTTNYPSTYDQNVFSEITSTVTLDYSESRTDIIIPKTTSPACFTYNMLLSMKKYIKNNTIIIKTKNTNTNLLKCVHDKFGIMEFTYDHPFIYKNKLTTFENMVHNNDEFKLVPHENKCRDQYLYNIINTNKIIDMDELLTNKKISFNKKSIDDNARSLYIYSNQLIMISCAVNDEILNYCTNKNSYIKEINNLEYISDGIYIYKDNIETNNTITL